jgi:hypothetical protein
MTSAEIHANKGTIFPNVTVYTKSQKNNKSKLPAAHQSAGKYASIAEQE